MVFSIVVKERSLISSFLLICVFGLTILSGSLYLVFSITWTIIFVAKESNDFFMYLPGILAAFAIYPMIIFIILLCRTSFVIVLSIHIFLELSFIITMIVANIVLNIVFFFVNGDKFLVDNILLQSCLPSGVFSLVSLLRAIISIAALLSKPDKKPIYDQNDKHTEERYEEIRSKKRKLLNEELSFRKLVDSSYQPELEEESEGETDESEGEESESSDEESVEKQPLVK